MEDPARLLRAAGLTLIAAAAAFGLIAWQHMRSLAAYGHICGDAVPHCPACPASLAALALGAACLAWAARMPTPRPVPARR